MPLDDYESLSREERLRRAASIEHARLKLKAWIEHYNTRRPHQSLGYKTPNQYHQHRCKSAA